MILHTYDLGLRQVDPEIRWTKQQNFKIKFKNLFKLK